MKVGNLGVMHKTRIEGALQTFTFGIMQLVDTMQPGGATTTSKTTKFSPEHRKILGENFKKKICFHCKARSSDWSFRHKKYLRISLRFGETAT